MTKKLCRSAIVMIALLCLTSCGYRFGDCDSPWVGSTVSVPYVDGDCTGEFTRTLVRELASSGSFQYVTCGGCYRLCVSVCDECEEYVGFRYQTNKENQLTRTVIPVESRSRVTAEFSLVEAATGVVVLGPERVSASAEYDHEFEGGSNALNLFSLGQVTDLEAAKEVVPYRVGRVLAERIVDYLRGAW